MSQSNPGRGHNGNRGRELQTDGGPNGSQQKRRRSPSSDSNNVARERSARRREEVNERDPDELIRQGAQLQAVLTTGTGISLGQPVSAMVSNPSKVMEIMSQVASDSAWILARAPSGIFGQSPALTSILQPSTAPEDTLGPTPVQASAFSPPLPPNQLGRSPFRPKLRSISERVVAASRARRPPVSHSGSVFRSESNESQIMPRVNGLHCKICKSQTHEAEHCSKIVDDDRLTDRQQGFKRWCPWHKSAGHTMDQCQQKWNWLRDKDLVEKLLVVNCGAGPAFATNMLDWRWLVTYDSSTPLPWIQSMPEARRERIQSFTRDVLAIMIHVLLPQSSEPIFHGRQRVARHHSSPALVSFRDTLR
ncbi:hypothetical protein F5Y07DRAFT_379767 [Xylaria sp. FL0933]|nr:hypothetical protein F5Y07DRAFT_379767 [Xylaria sp. FL0933]